MSKFTIHYNGGHQMSFLNNLTSKKIIIPTKISALLILFFSFFLSFFLYNAAPVVELRTFYTYIDFIFATPSLFFLNYIPILTLMLLIYFLINNTMLVLLFSSYIFVLLGIANKLKIQMRQDPILPSDLTLIREVTAILKTFDKSFLMLITLSVALFILFVFVFIFFFKNKKISPIIRISGTISLLIAGFIVNQIFYNNDKLYEKFPVDGNNYFQVNQYNSKGLMYAFLHNFNTQKVQKPDRYIKRKFIGAEKIPIAAEKKDYPHIIMIMGEAFSDLSENKNLDFTGFTDPLENYKKLSSRPNSLSGRLVVPNFGGGTSDTEYDVLTALPTRYLDNTLPSYNFIQKKFDGLPRRLGEIGYETLAIHPGYPWFYNRQNVYNYLGFQNFITIDNFNLQTETKGGYVKDSAATDMIINTFSNHIKENDSPLFSFTVTIQNHGPYADKYKDTTKNFTSKVHLTEEEENMLSNYFNGIKDADIEIGKLVSYMENTDEPIVLVYFGDHLPGFANGMDFFDILDYDIDINGDPKERLAVYETPYVIWGNDASAAYFNMEKNIESLNLPTGNIMSSNYLGTTLLELMDIKGLSPLYDFSNSLRRSLPVITPSLFIDSDGTYTDTITKKQESAIDSLKGWEYYKLFDENID